MVAGDNVEKNSSSKIDMANYSLRRLAKVQFPNKCFALKKKKSIITSFINRLNPKITNSWTKTTENLINNKGVEYLNRDQTWAVIFCVMFSSCLKNSLWLFSRIITGVFWEHAHCTLLLRCHCFGLPNTGRTR